MSKFSLLTYLLIGAVNTYNAFTSTYLFVEVISWVAAAFMLFCLIVEVRKAKRKKSIQS